MIRCANGHENPDGSQVCAECGAPLGAAPPGEDAGGSFWARQEARSTGAAPEPAAATAPAAMAPAATAPAATAPAATAPAPPAPPSPSAPPVSAPVAAPAAEAGWDTDVAPSDDDAAVSTATPPSGGGASDVADRGGVIALVGAALLLFASFLPWARATGNLFYVTKDGIDTDGVITLLLAVVIGLVAALTLLRPPPSRVGAGLVLVGGVAGVGVSIYEMFRVDDAFDDLLTQVPSRLGVEARIGVGLYLALLASGIIVVGAVLAFVQGHRAHRPE
jgi:hypothetical protein